MTDSALAHAADLLDPGDGPDHADWCRSELPHVFPLPFGPHHLRIFSLLGRVAAGVRAFIGAPRGSGKTTALFFAALACIALRTHRFVVICGVTQEEAEARLRMIRNEIKRNRALVKRWPALRFARPAAGEEVDRKKEILLVGGRIVAIGAGAAIRGLIRETRTGELVRPDLFLGDDLETPGQARSKLLTDRLEEWLFADISQLGTNVTNPRDTRLDVIVIGTTLDTDAVAARALKAKGRFRTWQTATFPAERKDDAGDRVATWPEGQPLELLDRMLDPSSESFIGGYTYAKEYLLDPLERGDTVVKRASLVHAKVPRRQDGTVDLRFVWEGIDPAASESSFKGNDPSAIVSVGIDSLNRVWVFRAWRGWVSSDRLFDVAGDFVRADPDAKVAYEAVGGFKWGVAELRKRGIPNRPVAPSTDKISRFQPVALLYEANTRGFVSIIHDESLADTTFEEELISFPTGEHDDYVDGLWLAVKAATNDFQRRVIASPAA
jgi:hypothetical protein